MQSTPVTSSTPAVSAAQTDKVSTQPVPVKEEPVHVQPEAGTKVTISSAAVAALAARKEAIETPQQTAQEARGNDHQAQRLIARQAAYKA